MFSNDYDSVVFLILKEKAPVELLLLCRELFDIQDEELEDKVYIFKKEINWSTTNNYKIVDFYRELSVVDPGDFVFMRLGNSIDDYEFIGDCICNFNKYLNSCSINLIRAFEFSPKKTKIDIAKNYYLDEILDKDSLYGYFEVYPEVDGIIKYYEIFNTEEINYDNLDIFEFDGIDYIVIKNIPPPK